MKILILGFSKIKYMPYLNVYLENIDRVKNDVHLAVPPFFVAFSDLK